MKKIILTSLMFCMMCSVQIYFVGCEDQSESDQLSPDEDVGAEQFTPTNNYSINARIVGVDIGFGGLSACADVTILKDDQAIDDALVLVNEDTIEYSFGIYQASVMTSDVYNLTITHNGSTIATGSAKIPLSIPEIINLDSGDVHFKDTDLLVEWNMVDSVTAWQIVSTKNQIPNFESTLLPDDISSYTIPGINFSSGNGTEYIIQVNAINGLYPGDEEALINPEVGYAIDGPSGYLIGLNQSDAIAIYVND